MALSQSLREPRLQVSPTAGLLIGSAVYMTLNAAMVWANRASNLVCVGKYGHGENRVDGQIIWSKGLSARLCRQYPVHDWSTSGHQSVVP